MKIFTTKNGGFWTDKNTWEGDKIPSIVSDVVVRAGAELVIDVDVTINSIISEDGSMIRVLKTNMKH